jgi:probable O-glycosylation ligase (exosortase A-associated)
MGKILLLILIVGTAVVSLFQSWIGVMAYYILAIMGPQYIWWWNFEGIRVSFIVGVFALSGVVLAVLTKRFDLQFLRTKLNLWIFLLYTFLLISYFLGPYVSMPERKLYDPDTVFINASKIFLFYFCAVIAINEIKKLRYLSIIFLFITVFFIYWANMQYFNENWFKFDMGRLSGPTDIRGIGLYGDENAFAMLFVTGLPFLYFIGQTLHNKWFRYVLWAIIPFGWHAVFLTGSRGGLVGLGVIVLLTAISSKRKLIAALLIPLAVFFYFWQAGDVMKERAETIVDQEGEKSLEGRLNAWEAGAKMIVNHPITGVGIVSFMSAFPDYSEDKPRVAHNTAIQFAAESGVIAGVSYVMIIIMFFISYKRIKRWCEDNRDYPDLMIIESLNSASFVSFSGLIVCSLFLSLNFHEMFFSLLIFNNSLSVICSKSQFVTQEANVLRDAEINSA